MSKKRIFLYGSCVARDTSEFLSPDDFELAGYIARQSLISINRDCLSYWPENFVFESDFQQRVIRGDWQGNAWAEIEKTAPTLDALILDFTDERFGVYQFDGNPQTIATRTLEMLGTPLEDVAAQHELVEFGSDLHQRYWHWCMRQMAQRLKESGLFEKTIVLRVPWATETDLGKQLPTRMGLDPASANKIYERYYELAAAEGFKFVDLSDFPVYAEPLHQWGLAPYHYTIDVYQEIAHQLRTFLGI